MKYITAILSIYVLFLTAIPCVDAKSHLGDNFSANTEQHNHNENDHQDQCSPFCTCDCCATQIINEENKIDFTVTLLHSQLSTFYKNELIIQLSNLIWQPPQIS